MAAGFLCFPCFPIFSPASFYFELKLARLAHDAAAVDDLLEVLLTTSAEAIPRYGLARTRMPVLNIRWWQPGPRRALIWPSGITTSAREGYPMQGATEGDDFPAAALLPTRGSAVAARRQNS